MRRDSRVALDDRDTTFLNTLSSPIASSKCRISVGSSTPIKRLHAIIRRSLCVQDDVRAGYEPQMVLWVDAAEMLNSRRTCIARTADSFMCRHATHATVSGKAPCTSLGSTCKSSRVVVSTESSSQPIINPSLLMNAGSITKLE